MIYIQVPDNNDSVSSLELENVKYFIRFTYNSTYDYWSFGIWDENEKPIVQMVKIVPYFPLFRSYMDARLPEGIFYATCDNDRIGRDDFTNKVAEFCYITADEVGELYE